MRTIGLILALLFIEIPAWSQSPIHLWSHGFGSPIFAEHCASYGVAVDAVGNVSVIGWFDGTVDFGGGQLTSAGGSDIFLAHYDPTGTHLWSYRFGDTSDEGGSSVSVDAAGNVLVTGHFRGTVDFGGGPLTTSPGFFDIFLAKYGADGNHLWSKRLGGSGIDEGNSVTVDAAGNVLATGYFQRTVDFGGGPLTSWGGGDIFLAHYDPAGNHLWSKRIGGSSSEEGVSVTVDASGNVLVTGFFRGIVDFGGGQLVSSGLDIFLAKYDATGNHLWSQRFGGTSSDRGLGVTVDAAGNVLMTGYFLRTADFGGGPLVSAAGSSDIFLAKYDAAGNHLWSKRFGDTSVDHGYSVSVDAAGNALATGYFRGTVDFGGGPLTNIGSHVYLVSYDADGNHLWSGSFGGPTTADQGNGRSLAVDAEGKILATGSFAGVVDFGGGTLANLGGSDMFLAKFDLISPQAVTVVFDIKPGSCPNPLNTRLFDEARNKRSRKGGVLPVAILGSTELDVHDLDVSSLLLEGVTPIRFNVEDVASGLQNADLCECTTDGPDGFDDLALKFVAHDVAQNIVLGVPGEEITLTLTGSLLDGTPIKGQDCVVLVSGRKVPIEEESKPILGPAFPNPFNPLTRIRYVLPEKSHATLAVFTVTGELVATLADGVMPAGEHVAAWDAKGVPSGVYFYRLTAGSLVQTKRMVLLK